MNQPSAALINSNFRCSSYKARPASIGSRFCKKRRNKAIRRIIKLRNSVYSIRLATPRSSMILYKMHYPVLAKQNMFIMTTALV